ncbi:hypothetical protein [Nocardia sp. bgisy134]|uniref:hypothetical protein n=1 Tax=Nocardia sp. bgisy134 TaxID=3413789 RepID=UPI003D749B46
MSEQDLSQWQRFADQARAGDLYLDKDAATACLTACDGLLAAYDGLFTFTRNAARVSGFGDFNIAGELAALFLKQATGESDSIDAVVLESIKVVQAMREIMQISMDRIEEQVVDHASQIAGVTNELGDR